MKIYTHTVSGLLWKILNRLMELEELKTFRLVGGTSLSLLLGHRLSVDIDLFSDAGYGTIRFDVIDRILLETFPYVDPGFEGNNILGKSYFIGENPEETVKVDMFYTDPFVFPPLLHQGLRISRAEEIIAMKLDVIGRNGRKKDFWDIHELLDHFSLPEMLDFYAKRYPYGHTQEEIISKLTDFEMADADFDPVCLKGKYWELVKLDLEESVREHLR